MKLIAGIGVAALGAALLLADDKADRAKLRQAVDAAKIHFHDAVAVAQKEVGDGRVVEVELDWEDGAARYEVEMLVGDAWKEVQIDAVNGKVLRVVTDVKPDDAEDRHDVADARHALDGAKKSMNDAIDVSMQNWKNARLVEVDLERRGGKIVYDVTLLDGDKLVRATIDAIDGKVSPHDQ